MKSYSEIVLLGRGSNEVQERNSILYSFSLLYLAVTVKFDVCDKGINYCCITSKRLESRARSCIPWPCSYHVFNFDDLNTCYILTELFCNSTLTRFKNSILQVSIDLDGCFCWIGVLHAWWGWHHNPIGFGLPLAKKVIWIPRHDQP